MEFETFNLTDLYTISTFKKRKNQSKNHSKS